jgi:hypothetical protein
LRATPATKSRTRPANSWGARRDAGVNTRDGIVNLPTVMLQWPINTSAIDFPSYRGYRFPRPLLATVSGCIFASR